MDRRFASLLVLATLALPTGLTAVAAFAPPAEARSTAAARSTRPVVEDASGLLPEGRADALRKRLATVPADGLAVVFTRNVEAGGIERQAEDAFQAQRLGPRALSVAIAIDDRKVAVHVGQDLRRRGIDREVITEMIGAHFKAHARAGNYDDGAFALADAIARHPGRAAARDGARPPAPARPAPDEPGMGLGESLGWLVFGLFMFIGLPLLLLGGAIWFFFRLGKKATKEKATKRTRARLDVLEASRDRVMAGVVELDGAIALARGAGEDPSQATATAVMAEAQAFATRVEAVGMAFPAPDAAEEDDEVAALEMIALNLEVSIAALRTAYQAGEHGAFNDALRLGRRWKLVEAQVALLAEQSRGTAKKRALLEDLVAKGRAALTSVPQDLSAATDVIAEAETTLAALGLTKIEDEAPATSASSRVPAASSHVHGIDCWDVSPVHVHVVSHHSHSYDHHDSHDDDASSSSSGSWWGSSASASASWESSDSGSSSWSSSSDDDSNRWSSSDSGSSSWDSGSSSSDSSSSSSGSDSW